MMPNPTVVLYLFFYVQIYVFVDYTFADESNDEVKIEVLFMPEDCKKQSKKGDLLNVHYDGYLAKDGSQFYCSRSDKAGHPQWFVLGVGQVIKGLDIGMIGMCAGEKRKITVPPALAFGENGKDPIPPNSTLIFEVEVYSVSRGPRSMEFFREVDIDQDKTLTKTELKEYLKLEAQKDGGQRGELYYEKMLTDMFRKSDHNGDGLISVTEYNVYGHDEL